MQSNTLVLPNDPFIRIPSELSDGMSTSKSVINHYYPTSLCLHSRNWNHVLRVELEKGDLINQSSASFILFITNSFLSSVLPSPHRVCDPRVMDWSRIRSHSSVIQSFILSNTIERHFWNAILSKWMDMREGRFFNSNDSCDRNE